MAEHRTTNCPTPNQIVAYNLKRLRLKRGWSQVKAAEVLAPYIGKRWSRALFSIAERNEPGKRGRPFTADELIAFAFAFQEPVAAFFVIPEGTVAVKPAGGLAQPVSAYQRATTPEELTKLVTIAGEVLRGGIERLTQNEEHIRYLGWDDTLRDLTPTATELAIAKQLGNSPEQIRKQKARDRGIVLPAKRVRKGRKP